MSADYGQLDGRRTWVEVQARGRGHWANPGVAPGQFQQLKVRPGRTDQTEPETGPVASESGRNRDRAHVEQIDEIRVKTQVAVQGDRLGQHLSQAIDGGRGG